MSINLMLIIVILVAAYKLTDGYKRGMVKEIISLVSLFVLGAVLSLLAYGIGSYHDGKIFHVILVVVLLALLGIVHHLLGLVFFSAKMISKLPIISWVNKLLGAVFGVLEVVFFLWIIYTLVAMLNMGAPGEIIMSLTEESQILTWIHDNNWLARGIQYVLAEFEFVPLNTL